MKRTILVFIELALLSLISCSNEETFVYSCNEGLNNWAKENLFAIQKMTREDWKALSEEKKKVAYAAFSCQQRILFWEEKIKELKALDWSYKEWEHIKKLQDFIKKHHDFFTNKKLTDDQSDELHFFCTTVQRNFPIRSADHHRSHSEDVLV